MSHNFHGQPPPPPQVMRDARGRDIHWFSLLYNISSLNVLNFFKQVVRIFKWLFHLAKLFFGLGNFVSFCSTRLQMWYLQFKRSKFPHIATDVEFASLPTLIWLETLIVNFTQETVLVPGVFVLRKQRHFVSASVFIFMMILIPSFADIIGIHRYLLL